MGFLEKIRSTVEKYSMLGRGEKVLVGLSGGPDSVCLLMALMALSSEYDLTLNALYVDHGLRPGETPNEIEFCRAFCAEHDVPFSMRAVDVKDLMEREKLGVQDAARRLRYEAYEEEADKSGGGTAVALGHTADDQLETFMMRFLRGSGTTGLGSIPPVRDRFIRPLIETTREEITGYLKGVDAGFITDPTNLEDKYLRNKVRHTLIPILKELNPNIIETALSTSEVMRDEDRYLEAVVNKTLMKLISRKSASSIELFLSPLESMDKVILRRVLRRAVSETKGLGGIGSRHIEDITGLVKGSEPGSMITLPGDIRAIKKYSTLLLTAEPPARITRRELTPPADARLDEAGLLIKSSIEEAGGNLGDGKRRAVFDADKVKVPLVIRAREDGDIIHPHGLGHRKKVHDLFIDEKVPRHERDTVPIVTTKDGDVLWVAGYRADERFAVGEGTKRFLVLELKVTNI